MDSFLKPYSAARKRCHGITDETASSALRCPWPDR